MICSSLESSYKPSYVCTKNGDEVFGFLMGGLSRNQQSISHSTECSNLCSEPENANHFISFSAWKFGGICLSTHTVKGFVGHKDVETISIGARKIVKLNV
jgi:hypothetical protein